VHGLGIGEGDPVELTRRATDDVRHDAGAMPGDDDGITYCERWH
jgi:precorrin-2 methylase